MTANTPSLLPSSTDFQVLQTIADNAAKSGLYAGVGSQQKILMVLLAAQELGIKPLMALNGGLWNIQGKIEISARLMSSMIRRAGHSINIIKCDSKVCILEGKRKDGDSFRAQFTIEDAIKAGLIRKNRDGSDGIWMKYTEDMLYNRALSRLARRLFADIIGTSYIEGEIRDGDIEIISCKQEEQANLTEIKEDVKIEDENIDQLVHNFLESVMGEDPKLVKTYLEKYANHWKKTMTDTLEDYKNPEKFIADFTPWKNKLMKIQNSKND